MAISHSHDFFIQWHLTERCNLRCRHCYQQGAAGNELSLDEVRDAVEEAAEMIAAWTDAYGVRFSGSFNLTGGEPLLRDDLPDIGEEIVAHGFDLYLLTNGTLVTREKARMLSDIGVSGVQVSVEGPQPVHDRLRGDGAYGRAMKGVRHLLDAGHTVTLNATLSAVNSSALEELRQAARDAGVQRLGISRLVPQGRGAEMIHAMLSPDEARRLYEQLFSSGTAGPEIVTGDPVASQLSSPAVEIAHPAVPSGGCAAAVSGLTILADGSIIPCRRLPVPIGTIRRDSLREIWTTSEVLNRLRDRTAYSGRCGRCSRWPVCRGCRAIAYACSAHLGTADLCSDDPQCFIADGDH